MNNTIFFANLPEIFTQTNNFFNIRLNVEKRNILTCVFPGFVA